MYLKNKRASLGGEAARTLKRTKLKSYTTKQLTRQVAVMRAIASPFFSIGFWFEQRAALGEDEIANRYSDPDEKLPPRVSVKINFGEST